MATRRLISDQMVAHSLAIDSALGVLCTKIDELTSQNRALVAKVASLEHSLLNLSHNVSVHTSSRSLLKRPPAGSIRDRDTPVSVPELSASNAPGAPAVTASEESKHPARRWRRAIRCIMLLNRLQDADLTRVRLPLAASLFLRMNNIETMLQSGGEQQVLQHQQVHAAFEEILAPRSSHGTSGPASSAVSRVTDICVAALDTSSVDALGRVSIDARLDLLVQDVADLTNSMELAAGNLSRSFEALSPETIADLPLGQLSHQLVTTCMLVLQSIKQQRVATGSSNGSSASGAPPLSLAAVEKAQAIVRELKPLVWLARDTIAHWMSTAASYRMAAARVGSAVAHLSDETILEMRQAEDKLRALQTGSKAIQSIQESIDTFMAAVAGHEFAFSMAEHLRSLFAATANAGGGVNDGVAESLANLANQIKLVSDRTANTTNVTIELRDSIAVTNKRVTVVEESVPATHKRIAALEATAESLRDDIAAEVTRCGRVRTDLTDALAEKAAAQTQALTNMGDELNRKLVIVTNQVKLKADREQVANAVKMLSATISALQQQSEPTKQALDGMVQQLQEKVTRAEVEQVSTELRSQVESLANAAKTVQVDDGVAGSKVSATRCLSCNRPLKTPSTRAGSRPTSPPGDRLFSHDDGFRGSPSRKVPRSRSPTRRPSAPTLREGKLCPSGGHLMLVEQEDDELSPRRRPYSAVALARRHDQESEGDQLPAVSDATSIPPSGQTVGSPELGPASSTIVQIGDFEPLSLTADSGQRLPPATAAADGPSFPGKKVDEQRHNRRRPQTSGSSKSLPAQDSKRRVGGSERQLAGTIRRANGPAPTHAIPSELDAWSRSKISEDSRVISPYPRVMPQ